MSWRTALVSVTTIGWTAGGIASGVPVLWLVGGVVIAVLALAVDPADASHADELALRRQLAVARRRGDQVDVVCAAAIGVAPHDVAGALRISDFATVREGRGGVTELRAVVDTSGLDREAFETRVRHALGGRWRFAWARFPEDGATFDALLLHARAHAAPDLTLSDHPGGTL